MAHEGSIVMPLGKYKGTELSDIPTPYLDWLIGQDWMAGRDLGRDILAHLNTRADWKTHDDIP
jgi:uncharacterized protein (DUF3820 family)